MYMIRSIVKLSGAAAIMLSTAVIFSGGSAASPIDHRQSAEPDPQQVEVVTGAEYEALGSVQDVLANRSAGRAAKSGCSGPWSGYAGIKWTTANATSCNIAGSTGYKKTYSWEVPNFSSGRACAQGRGYNSTGGNKWASLGCGTGGSGSVSWGKRLSYPSYKAKSLAIPLGTPTLWR